jgi:ribosomal protein S8
MLSLTRGQAENKKCIVFQKSKIIENLLSTLYSEGLIFSFNLITPNIYTVYLKYYGSGPIISNIKVYKKKSYSNSITIKKLKKLIHQNPSSIFIINTSAGFISQSEALRCKFLGTLCFKIN